LKEMMCRIQKHQGDKDYAVKDSPWVP